MPEVTTQLIKQLRDATNAGMMDSKRALEANDGDIEKAKDWLRQKGITKASERAGRTAAQGAVAAYVHRTSASDPEGLGRVGAMVEVNSESDFVARNEIFQGLARELCLQVAGSDTVKYVRREEVPPAVVEREREVAIAQAKEQGKEAMAEKIAEGKLNSFYQEVCLLEQKWAKDDKRKVQDLVDDAAAQLKENIVVSRFARFKVGETAVLDLHAGEPTG
jgi:elongation factor Ts